jgi:hypothetical protein
MSRAAYLRSSFFGVALWMLPTASAPAQTTSTCQSFNSFARATLNAVRSIATGSDSNWIRSRATTRIPQVSASQVSYVTDAKVCQSAVNAYAAAANVPATGRQVYVVKVGNYYVVKDPTVRTGEWYFTVTMDRRFAIVARYTG